MYLFAVTDTSAADSTPSGPPSDHGIFDEPSISRQWVARRLQRALSIERWGGAVRGGFASLPDPTGALLGKHADAAASRASRIYDLIEAIGAKPYGHVAFGGSLVRGAARLFATVGRPPARKLAHMLAEHTLSEYENLGALTTDAPGVSVEIAAAIVPLQDQVLEEFRELDRARKTR